MTAAKAWGDGTYGELGGVEELSWLVFMVGCEMCKLTANQVKTLVEKFLKHP